ncbi:DUF2637 domain-containing protein [uncultured Thermomonospora sp.]|jgi:hypothetical protein|uniref:DUF2637 domain-containing protein n=1 Tax=uncultured Thermomonospora sp. TaxID=671175 RepID=UPI00259B4423|nr:DUF2637 domain-containing protein [uncultured Thermomonospora sp.]
MRRLALRLLDSGPVVILALIAGAGSFTHIRDTAIEAGQTGWMAWAVAVCVDLTCVMAARERQRDKKIGRKRNGPISWPTLVLIGGIVLSLAANLRQAQPTVWGWVTAATPAVAFLVAVSMLERRASGPRPAPADRSAPAPAAAAAPEPVPLSATAAGGLDEPHDGRNEVAALPPALVDYARRVADEHAAKTGNPISRDALRARLGVSNQLAADLLRRLQPAAETG